MSNVPPARLKISTHKQPLLQLLLQLRQRPSLGSDNMGNDVTSEQEDSGSHLNNVGHQKTRLPEVSFELLAWPSSLPRGQLGGVGQTIAVRVPGRHGQSVIPKTSV